MPDSFAFVKQILLSIHTIQATSIPCCQGNAKKVIAMRMPARYTTAA